jgi:FimV-like protein
MICAISLLACRNTVFTASRVPLVLSMVVSTVALWLFPFPGWTLSLGDIELRSSLNQPLEADIFIVSATPEEISNLQVALASPETFELYGLNRSDFLSELQFQVTKNDIGQEVIRILSESDVTSPSMTIFLDITWPGGQSLSEYTLELRATQSSGIYGPVRRGETLWSLAGIYLPPGIIVNQMMIAMYRANPGAFNGNINLLLEGALLRIPGSSEASQVDPNEASQEAIRQTQEWQENITQTAGLLLMPVIDETSADTATPINLETENAVLQGELTETQLLLSLRNSELAELQSRITAMEELSVGVAGSSGSDLTEVISGTDNSSVPAVVTLRTGQSTFLSWVGGFLTAPLLLIGMGLFVLVGTAVWYLRYRQRAEITVAGRWETLETHLPNNMSIIENEGKNKTTESEVIDVGMNLDLGRAYIDMGDLEAARKVLEEVIEEGDAIQQKEAKTLLVGLLLK